MANAGGCRPEVSFIMRRRKEKDGREPSGRGADRQRPVRENLSPEGADRRIGIEPDSSAERPGANRPTTDSAPVSATSPNDTLDLGPPFRQSPTADTIDSESRDSESRSLESSRIEHLLERLRQEQHELRSEARSHGDLQVRLLESIVDRLASTDRLSSNAGPADLRFDEVAAERDRLQQEADRRRFEVEELRSEIDRLHAELVLLRSEPALEPASDVSAERDDEVDQLRRRLELALDDLREARAELASRPAADESDGAGLDWESQKRRLMAGFDSEDADDEGKVPSDAIEVRQIIEATDEAIRRKDEEILELQRLLQHQSENLGSFAVGAAAIEELLASDELIQQERDNLERLQAQWRDKLKQAEIEISMERARIARERKELDSQLQTFRQEQQRLEARIAELQTTRRPGNDPVPRNRWFSRLGLNESGDRS